MSPGLIAAAAWVVGGFALGLSATAWAIRDDAREGRDTDDNIALGFLVWLFAPLALVGLACVLLFDGFEKLAHKVARVHALPEVRERELAKAEREAGIEPLP